MKKTVNNINSLLSSKFKNIKAVLIYGQDYGLVSEIFNNISNCLGINLSDSFSVFDFSVEYIISNKGDFIDKATALSFSSSRKLVRIKDVGNKITESLDSLLKVLVVEDQFLLITAGELDTKSKLRKIFDNPKRTDLISIPCFLENGTNKVFIKQYLSKIGLNASSEVIEILSENLGEDRLSTKSELEKLKTYLGKTTNVGVEDALSLVDSSSIHLTDFSMFMLGLDIQKSYLLYERLLSVGVNPIMLLRILIINLKKLYGVVVLYESGESMDIALRKNGVVFWKVVDLYKGFVRTWTSEGLYEILLLSQNADKEMKLNSAPIELTFSQFLLEFNVKAKKHSRKYL